MKKVFAHFETEKKYWQQNYSAIVGIDEVGRGSWAGPLVVAGVIFPPHIILEHKVADSKLLSANERTTLDAIIKEYAQAFSIVEVPLSIINAHGIGKATHVGFRKVLKELKGTYDFIFVDAFYINHVKRNMQWAQKHGDQISASIAAASIIAKVYRDNHMTQLDEQYPQYGFAKHKGYGTREHQQAIRHYGLSKLHRSSFNLSWLV